MPTGINGLPKWTTEVSLTTDAQGRVDFTDFYGDYEVVSGQRHAEFTLTKGKAEYSVALKRASQTGGTE
jgi:hypothetical protein